jgi:hypothetical protein
LEWTTVTLERQLPSRKMPLAMLSRRRRRGEDIRFTLNIG